MSVAFVWRIVAFLAPLLLSLVPVRFIACCEINSPIQLHDMNPPLFVLSFLNAFCQRLAALRSLDLARKTTASDCLNETELSAKTKLFAR